MRTIIIGILSLFILSLLPSCSTMNKAQAEKFIGDVKAKCPDSHLEQLPSGKYDLYVKCVHLYDSTQTSKVVDLAKVNFDAKVGDLEIHSVSASKFPDLIKLFKGMLSGAKK